MTPNGPLYFDAYQGDPNDEPLAIGNLATPQDVYEYEPVPAALTTRTGASYHRRARQSLDRVYRYAGLPVLHAPAAHAELERDRVERSASAHLERFLRAGGDAIPVARASRLQFPNSESGIRRESVNLRFANVSPSVRTVKAEVEAAQTNVVIATIVPGGVIHYTIDGTAPTAASPIYGSPITVTLAPNQRADIQAIVTMPSRRTSTVSELVLTRVTNPR